jgi:hypothetical protein
MNPNEAAAALDAMNRTQARLADHARFPFRRHAMFGLMEGLIVAGIAQPLAIGSAMTGAGLALLVTSVMQDRRQHGMLVTSWKPGTRGLIVALSLFMLAMVVAAALIRDGETVQPLGYLLGVIAFVVCTAASMQWEKKYRAHLLRGEAR